MELPLTIKEYATYGAGGVSFMVLVYILFYIIQKVLPVLQELRDEVKLSKDYINNAVKNNKDFSDNVEERVDKITESYDNVLDEIKNSNNNIAKSLELLSQSQEMIVKLLDKSEERSINMEKEITKLNERLNIQNSEKRQ